MERITALPLLALCALAACRSVGEDYVPPPQAEDAPAAWNGRLDGVITAEELDPQTLATWWTTLEDSTLTELVEGAIRANLDLRVAEAQLKQARAQRQVAASEGAPQIGTSGSGTRSGSSSNPGPGGTGELYTAGLDASWELDVFGGISRAVEAADADLDASVEARRDVLVTITAEVALNYADLRAQERRLAFSEQNLALQKRSLGIVEMQLEEGAVSELDLNRAIGQVSTTEAAIPTLRQQIVASRNRIAVLLGRAPGSLDSVLARPTQMEVPSIRVAVGIPANVLRRRPDVRAAERQLAAATARTGVAIADLYPKFSLAGSIGLESLSLSSLFETASRAFSLGPRIQWSPFNGGRLRAQVDISEAVQEETLLRYEQSVLGALEEVENAITAYAEEQLRYKSLQEAEAATLVAAEMAQERFDLGASDFLPVLDAQRELLNAQDALAVSEGEIAGNLIRLYKALGGGWDPEAPTP